MKIKVPEICQAINDRAFLDSDLTTDKKVLERTGSDEVEFSEFMKNEAFTPIQRLDVFVTLLDDLDVATQWAKLVSIRTILHILIPARSHEIQMFGLSFLAYLLKDGNEKKLNPITEEYLSKMEKLTLTAVEGVDLSDIYSSVCVLDYTYRILNANDIEEVRGNIYLIRISDSNFISEGYLSLIYGSSIFTRELEIFRDYKLDIETSEKLAKMLGEEELYLQFQDALKTLGI
jgi:hypothetical protein